MVQTLTDNYISIFTVLLFWFAISVRRVLSYTSNTFQQCLYLRISTYFTTVWAVYTMFKRSLTVSLMNLKQPCFFYLCKFEVTCEGIFCSFFRNLQWLKVLYSSCSERIVSVVHDSWMKDRDCDNPLGVKEPSQLKAHYCRTLTSDLGPRNGSVMTMKIKNCPVI